MRFLTGESSMAFVGRVVEYCKEAKMRILTMLARLEVS